MRTTALVIVDEVASSLAFRVERMGLEKKVEAPGGCSIAFAIWRRRGGTDHSVASARKDEPRFATPE